MLRGVRHGGGPRRGRPGRRRGRPARPDTSGRRLALFGSVCLRQTIPAKKSDRWYRKACAIVVFQGTLGLALLHILFAGVGETFFSLEFTMSLSAVLMGAIVASYGTLTRPQDE